MDFQKITSTGTAIAVVSTGAVVGGNKVIDNVRNGPEIREERQIEKIRQVVAEEIYKQLVNTFPDSTGQIDKVYVPKKQ
tara:strand:- start:1597 stop:1833 length:237 start_codon:yes stop_codon:yes gene_type:complete